MDKLELIVSKIIDLKEGTEKAVDNITSSVNNINKELSELKIETTRNTDNLEIHMRRTELSEHRLQQMEDVLEQRLRDIENRLTIKYLLKLIFTSITSVGAIAGSAYAIIKLINSLNF